MIRVVGVKGTSEVSARCKTFIVDGYNVIRRVPAWRALFAKNVDAARRALLQYCREWRAGRRDVEQVIVVFDGDSSVGFVKQARIPGVRTLFTKTGEEADQRIILLVSRSEAPSEISVVSDDGEVIKAARSHRAMTMSAKEFHDSRCRQRSAPETSDKVQLTPGEKDEINEMVKRAYGIE